MAMHPVRSTESPARRPRAGAARRAVAGIAALALGPAAAAWAGEALRIEPGKWEIRSESTNSMMPTPRVHEETRCVTETEWDPDTFMKDAAGCRYSDVVSSASELSWKVTCDTPGGSMNGDARYESTGETVSGGMDMTMAAGGMDVSAKVSWQGRRIGACD